jgi:hypothetical protein
MPSSGVSTSGRNCRTRDSGTIEQDTDVVMFVCRATAILEGHGAGMVEFDMLYAPALLDDLPDRT